MQRLLVAVLVVLAAGPAAVGGVAADGSIAVDGDHGASAADVASAQPECEYPLEVTDATGETVVIEEEPEEVVVTAPSAAQHLWDIGAREKVTGMPVNFFTSYLEGSEERTNVVGEQGAVVQETIVDLDPDLVLAPNVTAQENIQGLREAGLTVYHYPLATDLENVQELVRQSGQLVGECEGADEVVTDMQETIETIEDAVADEEQPTVFYNLGFPFTAGSNTVEHDIITTAGGENLAADADSGYFQISEEVLAAEDPEWIIILAGTELPDVAGIQESTAVQEDQIIEVNANFLNQHGPRTMIPLEQFAEAFHPEAIAEARATPTPTPTVTPTETPADDVTPTPTETMADETPTDVEATETPSDGDDGAGFAIGAALAAIAALAVIGQRRR
jgi:iron complex transport system substrate-binding protein